MEVRLDVINDVADTLRRDVGIESTPRGGFDDRPIKSRTESRAPEIAACSIRTMLVEPGFFRSEPLTSDSATYAQPTIDDYAAGAGAIQMFEAKAGALLAQAQAHGELFTALTYE